MDILVLPKDVVGYIRSFLTIVSWRAEHHYGKLLQRYNEATFESLPDHIKSTCKETEYSFVYPHRYGYMAQIPKTNIWEVVYMKRNYIQRYIDPLRDYLNDYATKLIQKAWQFNITTTWLGVQVEGYLTNNIYKYSMIIQGCEEGKGNECNWSGCLSLDQYRTHCIKYAIPRIKPRYE